jgi:hypothetical protein
MSKFCHNHAAPDEQTCRLLGRQAATAGPDPEMMKAALLLCCVASTNAHGSGAWKDPNHWKEDGSFAGMRYISEGPPHELTIVGSGEQF